MPEYISKGGEWSECHPTVSVGIPVEQSAEKKIEEVKVEEIKKVEKVEEKPITNSKPKGRKLRRK